MNGTPGIKGFVARPVEARFWDLVDRRGPDECWNWLGSLTADGYGEFNHRPSSGKAHRYSYTLAVGPIPKGLTIDHLCRNKRCVNPTHMEPVTRAENQRRAAAERTTCRYGHPLDGRVSNGGGRTKRYCKTCSRARYTPVAARAE